MTHCTDLWSPLLTSWLLRFIPVCSLQWGSIHCSQVCQNSTPPTISARLLRGAIKQHTSLAAHVWASSCDKARGGIMELQFQHFHRLANIPLQIWVGANKWPWPENRDRYCEWQVHNRVNWLLLKNVLFQAMVIPKGWKMLLKFSIASRYLRFVVVFFQWFTKTMNFAPKTATNFY